MVDSLKKGITPKYLFPIAVAYVAAIGLVDVTGVQKLQAVIPDLVQHLGLAGVASVVFLVMQDLLPRSVKEVIVFWRLRNRVPGFRAFSVIARRDHRIDQLELRRLLSPVPSSPAEENALWYRWLKAAGDDAGIADNHHRFLALRDSAVFLLLLTVVSPSLLLLPQLHGKSVALITTAICLAAYLLTMIAARNAAARLVGNVIALKVALSPPQQIN